MVSFSGFTANREFLDKFSKYSKITGVIFILIGIAGMLFPSIMSVATALFYGWLLIFSGFMIGFHTFQTNKKDWLGWLKAFIFFIVGAFIVINPIPGVQALGIILAIYFFMDAFASMVLTFEIKPEKWWWLILLNGFLSIFLGVYTLVYWPISSFFIVGFFVGVSLFFDGVVLLTMGKVAKDIEKDVTPDSNTSSASSAS
jgi:uncharacterized membrane protein HdeD (DUF308 family)